MKKLALLFCLVVGLGMIPAGAAHADTVSLGNWYEFEFGLAGSYASQFGSDPAPPWTYSESFATILTVTDIDNAGDMFTVYDNGTLVGSTSDVPNTGITNNVYYPDTALTSSDLSHGIFDLSPGSHSITIQVARNALNFVEGAAYFRVDIAPVPLPPTVYLLGGSLVGLYGFRLRRKNQA
jgi:hypothetical protein